MYRMSNEAMEVKRLADARRALARIEYSRAKCVARIERLQRKVAPPTGMRGVRASDDEGSCGTRWLREWVHVGTGDDFMAPWDALTWADVRTPSAAFPVVGSAYSVATSNEPRVIIGRVVGVQYHRRLAMLRTADGENYAGPVRGMRRAE